MNADRTRTAWTAANEDVILVAAKRRPWRSSRNFSRNLGLSQQKNKEEEEGQEEEEEEEEENKKKKPEVQWVILHSLRWGGLANISLKVPKLYSLELLAKVDWRQASNGIMVGSEESNVMGRGLLECTTEGSLTCRFNFEFCYIFNLDGCIITKFWWSWKGYLLDGNLEINIFSAEWKILIATWILIIKRNLVCVHELSICSRAELTIFNRLFFIMETDCSLCEVGTECYESCR